MDTPPRPEACGRARPFSAAPPHPSDLLETAQRLPAGNYIAAAAELLAETAAAMCKVAHEGHRSHHLIETQMIASRIPRDVRGREFSKGQGNSGEERLVQNAAQSHGA